MPKEEISDAALVAEVSGDAFHVGLETARRTGLSFDITTEGSSVFDLIAEYEEHSGMRVIAKQSMVRATFRPGSTRPTKIEREGEE